MQRSHCIKCRLLKAQLNPCKRLNREQTKERGEGEREGEEEEKKNNNKKGGEGEEI